MDVTCLQNSSYFNWAVTANCELCSQEIPFLCSSNYFMQKTAILETVIKEAFGSEVPIDSNSEFFRPIARFSIIGKG